MSTPEPSSMESTFSTGKGGCGTSATSLISAGYPRYYTVNDRPVMLAQAPDGSVDCLALDMRTGNLVVDRSYFPYLTPGAGRDVDALTESAFISAVYAIRADLVYRWCQRMCSVPTGSLTDLEDVLGIPLDPPPLAAREVKLEPDEVAIASITLRLPEPS